MANSKPTGTFHAEDVTVAKAGFLDQLARESLYKPIRIVLAATIPTAAGAAMVSLTTTSKTPSATPISCAISVKTELLGALRAMEQQNARLPRALSMVFAKAVDLLLQVHRSIAHQALGPGSSVAKPLPPARHGSPAGTRGNRSGLAYANARSTFGEMNEPAGLGAGGPEEDWLRELRQDVYQQVLPRSLPLNLNLGKVMGSSAPSPPSPVPSRGKDMKTMMAARQKEIKEKANKAVMAREMAKEAVQKR